jgi:hypothetical protein
VVMAYSLMDHQFWQSVDNLVQSGIVDRNIGNFQNFYFENYVLVAQGILSKIAIPYLQGELPK